MGNRWSSSAIFSQDLGLWKSSEKSRKTCKEQNIEPDNFEDRITFMSMFNDIDWTMSRHSSHDGGTIRGIWTSSVQRCCSTGSWNPEEEEHQGDHTHQCGCFEHRIFASNSSLCKSAQYLRRSRRMVWRFWCDFWWKASENYKWWYTECSSTKRSDFFGKSTKECSACSWKQSAWSSTELRNTGNRSPIYETL